MSLSSFGCGVKGANQLGDRDACARPTAGWVAAFAGFLRKVCRGTWARVTIDKFRHSAMQTL